MNYEEGWIAKLTTTFPRDRLQEMHKDLREPIKRFNVLTDGRYEDPEGNFWVWKMPDPTKLYDIGADVAEGHEDGDWSVAEVIERGSNEHCAEYREHILPRQFGDVLAIIGKFYMNAQIGPEVNNQGLSTLNRLNEIYSNVYLWRKQDSISPKFTGQLGWKTQYDTKQLLVGLTRERIWHRQCRVYSRTLWGELGKFIRDYTESGMITYRAAEGFDDCVMAWMIALKISYDEDFSKYYITSDSKPLGGAKPKPRDPAFYDAEGFPSGNKSGTNTTTGPWD